MPSATRTLSRPVSRSGGSRAAATAAVYLSLVLLQPALAATVTMDCEAILRDGVFDEHGVRGLDHRVRQARVAVCELTRSSQSFSVDVTGGLSAAEREVLCGRAASVLGTSDESRQLIDRMSSLAVSAFNECAHRNIGQVTHGIFTTDDPAVFTYHIQYTPGSAGQRTSVDVDAFEVHNASCRPPLKEGAQINPGRRTLICTREPEASVVIALNTRDNVGTRYLEPLRLDAARGSMTSVSQAAEPAPPTGPVTMRRYNRFKARRQIRESSCDTPSVELRFEERTQVKLIGEAVAQGGASRYPLWIRLLAGGQVSCQEQSWNVGRGRVTQECLVWVEANRPLRVEARQGSEDARCVSTDLEVWY